MATASVTYTFTNGTNADAIQVNQNFTDILTFINASLVQTDGSTSLANNAVTTAKINDGAVTSAKIADGTIVASDIANGTITAAKINAENWSSWTPVVKHGTTTLTNDSSTAKYIRYGDVVLVYFNVVAYNNSTNQQNNSVTISLPVNAKANVTAGAGRVTTAEYASSVTTHILHEVHWQVNGAIATARRGDVTDIYAYHDSSGILTNTTNQITFDGLAGYSVGGYDPGVIGFLVYEAE